VGGTPLVIRQAGRADRATLRRFHEALYVTHRDRVMPRALADFFAYRDLVGVLHDDVDSILARHECVALLAERDAVPVGYITGHVEADERRLLPRRGVVEDWYVEPSARGRGVGAALLEAIAAHFRALGCEVLESATWTFNAGARRAHERLGFAEYEVRYRKRL
jgi:GNAT superfamily N-acetyltransferase